MLLFGSAALKSERSWAEERGTEAAVEAEPSSFCRVASGSLRVQEPLLVSVEGVVKLALGGANPETDIGETGKREDNSPHNNVV